MSSVSKPKVICLGLGRTGTMSMFQALDMLGFGPCYHMFTIIREGAKDLATWSKIGDGNGTKEDIETLLQGYGSVLDCPAAMYGAELYSVYPDAKYILTTRDPAKWEISVKATVQYALQCCSEASEQSPKHALFANWSETYYLEKYHQGRLWTHTQEALLAHNDRVKQLIPSEKLLVYEVGEGWERLVDFLGVPIPTVPFPHVNNTDQFLERLSVSFKGLINVQPVMK